MKVNTQIPVIKFFPFFLTSFSRFSCHAVISTCNGLKTRMTADDRKAEG